VKPAYKDLALQ